DFDVARAQFDLVIEVLVFALVPDLHRAALALAGIADANAFGVVAAGTERAGAAGADPLVAAGVAFLLFFQAFLEFLDQLVQSAERLDLRALLFAQAALEFLAQPFLGNQRLQMLVEALQAIEVGAEGPVELVEVAFVLDHHGARQIVELVHVGEYHAVLQGIDQVEQFAHRHRYLGGAHFIEQAKQHCRTSGRGDQLLLSPWCSGSPSRIAYQSALEPTKMCDCGGTGKGESSVPTATPSSCSRLSTNCRFEPQRIQKVRVTCSEEW